MKTIKPPKALPKPVRITCSNTMCAAVMECELRELRFDSDRDGDAYIMKCPHCKQETWEAASVAASVLRDRAK